MFVADSVNLLATAFLMGLLGSGHCAGMCGGIVGALSLNVEMPGKLSAHPGRARLPYLLTYNAGRLVSYAAAGAILGFLVSRGLELGGGSSWMIGKTISALFMIALGLYLGGWWNGLVVLEKWGGVVWKRIEPLGKKFLPVRSIPQAFGLGLAWGWLPCGMVYAAIALAVTAGNAGGSALTMLAFGLGTLPMLVALGGLIPGVIRWVQSPPVRTVLATVVVLMGVYSLASVAWKSPAGHSHHHHAAMQHSMK